MMTITLYGRSTSANVQKVQWALGEVGQRFEQVQLGGRHGGLDAPEFGVMNPNRLVPVLKDGDLIVWESHAIVRYLAAQYGVGTLFPTDVRARALVDQWTDWSATSFQPAWVQVFWKLVRTPEAQRQPHAIEAARVETERLFAILDERLAKVPFLAGPNLTYADIVVGVAMYRWTTMEIAPDAHSNVEAWHGRLRDRAAFRAGVEIDYSELRPKATA